MKYFLIFLFLILIFLIFLNNRKSCKTYNKDKDNIKSLTKYFSIKRKVGSKGHELVKKRIIEMCEKIGLDVFIQKFRKENDEFSNIICYTKYSKYSNTNKNIVLGAHYDGYDDNGLYVTDSCTSIALILYIAKTILEKNPSYPLVLVFFDGEELIYKDKDWSKENSLIGSQFLAKSELLDKNSDIYIFDLIGSKTSKKIPFYKKCEKTLEIYKNLYDIDVKDKKEIFSGEISFSEIWDDHLPFLENGYNVIHLIPQPFPYHHHKVSDNLDNVDWEYLEYFYKVMLTHFLSYI